jgi:hypothetical protein
MLVTYKQMLGDLQSNYRGTNKPIGTRFDNKDSSLNLVPRSIDGFVVFLHVERSAQTDNQHESGNALGGWMTSEYFRSIWVSESQKYKPKITHIFTKERYELAVQYSHDFILPDQK